MAVKIEAGAGLYIKDPLTSPLGKQIIAGSIELIDQLGFEQFTFRKLANHIDSTEASVYRYFENKHKLLLYLNSWYWAWMDYRLDLATANIASAKERLKIALEMLTQQVETDNQIGHVNETLLHRIIINESSKAILTKSVDAVNKEGAFNDYKRVVERLSEMVLEINPEYKYPRMLISTVIEGAHLERFFAAHLPRLTNTIEGEDAICEFFKSMVAKTIDQ
ncbi:MAG: TetR/AcrR family transcriptional regulator [Salibacteraceae bacterium]